MIVGIDATNLRQGGGITHLVELLRCVEPSAHGISKVMVWGGSAVIAGLEDRPWLVKIQPSQLRRGALRRTLWQHFALTRAIRDAGCDLLFVPGGNYAGTFAPVVTMSRNMLPFETLEAARFGRFSLMRLKMRILRSLQIRSFRRAHGVIFLTQYALASVSKSVTDLIGARATALIPHGIASRFRLAPRAQREIEDCSVQNPFRVLYVSIVMPYKHQLQVARAASQLRAEGVPIEVRFIGESWGAYGRQLRIVLDRLDPNREFLLWSGAEPFDSLHDYYKNSDAFVFASSCENLPNILMEAMAAGLPIASSDRGPMVEVLGDAAVFFDPDSPGTIADALRTLAHDAPLRAKLAESAWQRANAYSWDRCARDTFAFIARVGLRQY
ncbi:MAG: N-acetylgalactosamine-N,N'-diacetylbacillosaminyl-diphospho-undecaprenol [Nitrospira sp.]|nr:N-acetylgalactosamine-N,N'-diacetylbacillosaminyl-diphospho-undecaprenol [Nitrospira sp.]